MSGDVQPRKRKDKRKKKGQLEQKRSEEYLEEREIFRRSSSTIEDEGLDYLNSNPEDIIHVHKDAFLGGNLCTKVIFFCLLGALGVMVSLIIFEYRGSNDLETQSAVDSPWSQMLEGWVDSNIDAHHDDHPDVPDDDDDDDDDNDEDDSDDRRHDIGRKKDDDDEDDDDDGDEILVKDRPVKEDKKSKKKSKSKKKDNDDKVLEKMEENPEKEQEEIEEEEGETSGGAGDSKIDKEIVASNESIEAVPKPETPELLSRRKTLVPPSFTEDIHPSRSPSPPLDEYSEDEGEGEEGEEEEAVESEHVKQTMEDLKAAYADLTPEPSDIEEDYERDPATKQYDYTSTPPESEPELSEPEGEEEEGVGDEEEEEEEEEDDEPRSEWQSNQSAHLLAEEVEDLQTESETEEESDDEPPPPPAPVVRRRGPQEIDENEQIFQDLVYETFEKVEQPLEQYSAKAEEPEKSEDTQNEMPVDDENELLEQNDGQDPWEPLSSAETFDEAATGNEKMNEEVDQPAESEVDQEVAKDYFNADITNDYDWEIHDDLDAADAELNQGDFNFI